LGMYRRITEHSRKPFLGLRQQLRFTEDNGRNRTTSNESNYVRCVTQF